MLRRAAVCVAWAASAAVAACAAHAPARGLRAPTRPEHRRVPPPSPDDSAAAARAVDSIGRIPGTDFGAGTFRGSNGVELRYRLLRPAAARAGHRYPLVVVFHGSGEIGTDNERQLDRFPKAWAAPAVRRDYPAFVVVPQFPARSSIYSGPAGDPERRSEPAPPLHAALELVDSLRRALPVDRARTYAIGFSMGASTVWNALWLRPDLFAAAIPIAGVPNRAHAPAVAGTPVWIIHGDRDEANPIGPDRAMHDSVRALGGRASFWEFEGTGHQVPPALLAGPELARWLFAHRKSAPGGDR
jgi:predicted peptidase